MHQPFRNPQPTDTYGAFEFRARSDEAKALVAQIHTAILQTEKRQRQRKAVDAERFYETVERFVGELLQAKARKGGTGRFGRAMSKRYFLNGIVGLDNVLAVRDGLKKLDFLIHTPGYPVYGPDFDSPDKHEQRKGEAAKFEAAPSLLTLAAEHGVALAHIHRHFPLERQLIVVRTSSVNDWRGKQHGRKVRFKHTDQTKEMERRIEAINEFIGGFEIGGADHRMLYRLFNQCDEPALYRWNKGGRLYADSGTGEASYQSLSSKLRSKIIFDGEKVIELDIASSYLTIFHALAGKPLVLSPNEDPYARIEADRGLVKGWMTISFGAGKLCERWSPEFSSRYADEHDGVRPTDICAATAIRDRALAAYPMLSRVGDWGMTWADLMFVESEVILKAMEALRHLGVPSLPVHDAVIVPASDAAAGARMLYLSFYHVVGALPVIKTKSTLQGVQAVVGAVWDEVKDLETKTPQINTRS